MAQWIYINKIPVDLESVYELVQKQKIQNYSAVVPSLKMTRKS